MPETSLVFPRLKEGVRARWAPIYLSPIFGSPERFVVAVAAASTDGFHIEGANALKRLQCLYGRAAETALFATEVALEELRSALTASGPEALKEGVLVFSGVSIGDVSEGEAKTLKELASTWMGALSSLYKFEKAETHEDVVGDGEADSRENQTTDRLPILVLDEINRVAPRLSDFFSDEIKTYRKRRTPSRVAGVSIDYSGNRLVANFATLHTSAQAHSLDRIKRKMFDLKVRRDEESGLFAARDHEMIIFSPSKDSPLVGEKQVERINEALEELNDQSHREGFRFSSMHAVPDIGQRLMHAEALLASH